MVDDRKSNSGYDFNLNGSIISWKCKKQVFFVIIRGRINFWEGSFRRSILKFENLRSFSKKMLILKKWQSIRIHRTIPNTLIYAIIYMKDYIKKNLIPIQHRNTNEMLCYLSSNVCSFYIFLQKAINKKHVPVGCWK